MIAFHDHLDARVARNTRQSGSVCTEHRTQRLRSARWFVETIGNVEWESSLGGRRGRRILRTQQPDGGRRRSQSERRRVRAKIAVRSAANGLAPTMGFGPVLAVVSHVPPRARGDPIRAPERLAKMRRCRDVSGSESPQTQHDDPATHYLTLRPVAAIAQVVATEE